MARESKPAPPIDLSISQDLYDSCKTALDQIVTLAEERPLAAVKLSLKLQLALRQIERNAALKANDNGKGISWKRIGEALGFGHTWAWERYKTQSNRILTRLAKEAKSEMENQPNGNKAE